MKMSRRFPVNFFKSQREDPILDESIGLDHPSVESKTVALSSIFSSSLGYGSAESDRVHPGSTGQAATDHETRVRNYVVNSIFSLPEIRDTERECHQQLVFVREQEGALIGMQEVNQLLRLGWSVISAFPVGNSAVYKALILLEKRSLSNGNP